MTDLITKKTEANKDYLNREPRTGAVGGPVGGVISIAVGAVAGREAFIRTFARDGKSTLFTMSAPSKRLFQRGLYPGFRAGW